MLIYLKKLEENIKKRLETTKTEIENKEIYPNIVVC